MATCSRCGKEIIWDVTPSGKRHPFDARPTLVKLVEGPMGAKKGFVSHFVTCPFAAEFGRENRLPETTRQLTLAEGAENQGEHEEGA